MMLDGEGPRILMWRWITLCLVGMGVIMTLACDGTSGESDANDQLVRKRMARLAARLTSAQGYDFADDHWPSFFSQEALLPADIRDFIATATDSDIQDLWLLVDHADWISSENSYDKVSIANNALLTLQGIAFESKDEGIRQRFEDAALGLSENPLLFYESAVYLLETDSLTQAEQAKLLENAIVMFALLEKQAERKMIFILIIRTTHELRLDNRAIFERAFSLGGPMLQDELMLWSGLYEATQRRNVPGSLSVTRFYGVR